MAQKKRCYNISGLRNQPRNQSPEPLSLDNNHVADAEHTPEDDSGDSNEWEPHVLLDSLKLDLQAEYLSDDEPIKDSDDIEEWDIDSHPAIGSKGLQAVMMKLSMTLGDDPHDEDWVPPKLRAKRERRKHERKG